MATLKLPGLAQRIREAMAEKGLKQQDLALRGIPQGKVSQWLKGTVPSFENLEKLSKALEVPWELLAVGEKGAEEIIKYRRRAQSARRAGTPGAGIASRRGPDASAPGGGSVIGLADYRWRRIVEAVYRDF